MPWIAACQASLPFTVSLSLLKPMSIELVIPSNHLILCCPLLLLSSTFPSIRVFSSELALCYSLWGCKELDTTEHKHTHTDTHTHRHTHTSNLRVCKSHLQTLVTLKCLLRKQVPGPTGGHLSRLYKHRGRWERLVWRTSAGPGAELV